MDPLDDAVDHVRGASGEVLGTPTLFIDGAVHPGGYDEASLLEALDGEAEIASA